MKFKADEIASVLREEISRYQSELDVAETGRVLEVGDGIAQIYGLSNAMVGEMLEFEGGHIGQVFNLEPNAVGAVIYGPCDKIKEGGSVRGTGRLLDVPVGDAMLGRVVNAHGVAIDGLGEIEVTTTRPVEFMAPGIAARQPVDEPLRTGLKAIDAMTPIGRGQRELIIGDRKTGKTAIAIDAILAQKDSDVLCVYVAIGQKDSTVAGVVETLRSHDAMKYTVVVSASSSDPAPTQYIAPYCGCAIAEHFMYTQGRATLVVYDDLTKQAAAYRQISLLLRRPPGREAYPGDVFYLHSRLLERACKLAEQYVIAPKGETADADKGEVFTGPLGLAEAKRKIIDAGQEETMRIHRLEKSGGSMTALPICETQEGEVSAYIPTNLIGITDGQIYLEPALFFSGVRPAVNVGISVSRVGYKAAWPAMKEVAKSLRLDLAAYRELESFSQLGMDLDASSQHRLERGDRMIRLLTQPQYQPMPFLDQAIGIFAGNAGALDDLDPSEVPFFEAGLLTFIKENHRELYDECVEAQLFGPDRGKQLRKIIGEYKRDDYRRERRERNKETGEQE